MASLNMGAMHALDSATINKVVAANKIGNYGLGSPNKEGLLMVGYVGRSDGRLRSRLLDHAQSGKYSHFKFSYATSVTEAYHKECRNYHDFKPKGNSCHPDQPDGVDCRCPVQGCEHC